MVRPAASAELKFDSVRCGSEIFQLACESIDAAYFPAFAASRALCEAARKRGEPPFGGD